MSWWCNVSDQSCFVVLDDGCLSHIVDFFSPMEAGSGHGGVPIAAVGYSHGG